ncbi:MAG TPA: hypothetical protein VEM94_07380 [Candidatus Dormibacteraeota bacterium]|nr:hypothetical protein [Candidatus Dormibacteraeota bacterium]
MAGRKLRTKTNTKPVEYADAEPSAFSAMLGGLIEANVDSRADRKKDFDSLEARVGIWVTDIDEGVTLDFRKGSLVVHNGLQAKRDLTIRAEAGTVMNLSNLKIGLLGMPIYYDDVGRSVAMKLVQGKLRIEGLLGNLATLNTVTRIFSVQ